MAHFCIGASIMECRLMAQVCPGADIVGRWISSALLYQCRRYCKTSFFHLWHARPYCIGAAHETLLLMVSLNYSVSIKSLWQFVLIAHSTFSRPYRHTLLSTRPIVLCKYRRYGILCVQPPCVGATWGYLVNDTLNHFESMQTTYRPYEKFIGNTEFSLWGCSWCIW